MNSTAFHVTGSFVIIPRNTGNLEFASIIARHPMTSYLSIKNCFRITDVCIPAIRSLVHLRKINLIDSGISIHGLNSLLENHNLEIIFWREIKNTSMMEKGA